MLPFQVVQRFDNGVVDSANDGFWKGLMVDSNEQPIQAGCH